MLLGVGVLAVEVLVLVGPVGRGAAARDQSRRQGAEGRARAGGESRVRAVEQSLPVLSLQAVIHSL